MIIRTSLVANSSTSVFIIANTTFEDKTLYDYINEDYDKFTETAEKYFLDTEGYDLSDEVFDDEFKLFMVKVIKEAKNTHISARSIETQDNIDDMTHMDEILRYYVTHDSKIFLFGEWSDG
jgi:hypothetical protein